MAVSRSSIKEFGFFWRDLSGCSRFLYSLWHQHSTAVKSPCKQGHIYPTTSQTGNFVHVRRQNKTTLKQQLQYGLTSVEQSKTFAILTLLSDYPVSAYRPICSRPVSSIYLRKKLCDLECSLNLNHENWTWKYRESWKFIEDQLSDFKFQIKWIQYHNITFSFNLIATQLQTINAILQFI